MENKLVKRIKSKKTVFLGKADLIIRILQPGIRVNPTIFNHSRMECEETSPFPKSKSNDPQTHRTHPLPSTEIAGCFLERNLIS